MGLDITRKAQRAVLEQLKTEALADLATEHLFEGFGPGPSGFLGFFGTSLPRVGISCESADPIGEDPESGVFEAAISVEVRSEAHDTGPDLHGDRVQAFELALYQNPIALVSALSTRVADFTALHAVAGGASQEVDGDTLVTTLTLTLTCIGADL